MSLDATRWAWKQQNLRPTEKLILLSLADRAGSDDTVWPSRKQIEEDTGADMKTVWKAIKRFCEIGLIEDTGARVGLTNRVKVLRLIGVKHRENDYERAIGTRKEYHYVYKTSDTTTCQYYIGVHSAFTKQDEYIGSGKWIYHHNNRKALVCVVISYHNTRTEAEMAESSLIAKHKYDELCMNISSEQHRLDENNLIIPETESLNIPKTERLEVKSFQKRNRNDSKNGMTNDSKNGICNLPIESTNEPTTLIRRKSEHEAKIPYVEIVNLYHEICRSMPRVLKLTDKRKRWIKNLWLDGLPTLEHWRQFWAKVNQSDFLNNRNGSGREFLADFEWTINPSNSIKIVEGRYDNRSNQLPF